MSNQKPSILHQRKKWSLEEEEKLKLLWKSPLPTKTIAAMFDTTANNLKQKAIKLNLLTRDVARIRDWNRVKHLYEIHEVEGAQLRKLD